MTVAQFSQVLTVALTLLIGVLTYFLKRFVDSVYRIEDRLNDHGEQIAEMRGVLGMTPRRRKTDTRELE